MGENDKRISRLIFACLLLKYSGLVFSEKLIRIIDFPNQQATARPTNEQNKFKMLKIFESKILKKWNFSKNLHFASTGEKNLNNFKGSTFLFNSIASLQVHFNYRKFFAEQQPEIIKHATNECFKSCEKIVARYSSC